MSSDDKKALLASLGLDEQPAPPASPQEDIAVEGGAVEPQEPPSPTALKIDGWGMRQGRELVEKFRSEEETKHLAPRKEFTKEEFESLKKNDRRKIENEHEEALADEMADFHASYFEAANEANERCVDPLRLDFMRHLLETPDYHALHRQTMLNTAASELATAALTKEYRVLQESRKKQQGAGDGEGEGEGGPKKPVPDGGGLQIDVMKAVNQAVKQGQQKVEAFSESGKALGLPEGSINPKRAAEIQKRIRNSPTLRRICELAGRYRRLAQSRQRQKFIHGQDEMVGVVCDNEVSRLLPSELVKLADEDLELDFARRFVERQTLCREVRATQPVAKGPFIAEVDWSGSMEGERIQEAKAVALALAYNARIQRRWCALVGFGDPGQKKVCVLPPDNWDEMALLEWLEAFFCSGSTYPELHKLQEVYDMTGAPKGVADTFVITDGAIAMTPEEAAMVREWKVVTGAKIYGLVVGCSQKEPLQQVCDELWCIPNLGVEQDAVGQVLGV